MAKRKRGKTRSRRRGGKTRRRSGRSKAIPLFATGGVLITAMNVLGKTTTDYVMAKNMSMTNRVKYGGKQLQTDATNWSNYAPAVGGILISAVATKVGANKIMRRVPVVGKKIRF